MHKLVSLFIFMILFCPYYVNSEFFTSISHMNRLVSTAYDLTKEIEAFFEAKTLNNLNTRRLFKSFNKLNQKAIEDSEKFIGNPMNCYLLIKQLTFDVEELFNSVVGFDFFGKWFTLK